VEEGSATLAAGRTYYEGSVRHFSTWNADQVLQSVEVAGCVLNASTQRGREPRRDDRAEASVGGWRADTHVAGDVLRATVTDRPRLSGDQVPTAEPFGRRDWPDVARGLARTHHRLSAVASNGSRTVSTHLFYFRSSANLKEHTMPIEWGGINLQSSLSNAVVDNTNAPSTVLDANNAFTVNISWSVPVTLAPFLGGQFRLRVYAESMGPGPEVQIGSKTVAVAPGQVNYADSIIVAANTLPGEGAGAPPVSGAYKIVTVLQHLNGGATEGSGFAENPLIQLRQP
jgi:hypothetical protein